MHIEFPGKTVIVTGGGHGFGRAIAHAFAARGAATWTCDINAEPLKVTAVLVITLLVLAVIAALDGGVTVGGVVVPPVTVIGMLMVLLRPLLSVT